MTVKPRHIQYIAKTRNNLCIISISLMQPFMIADCYDLVCVNSGNPKFPEHVTVVITYNYISMYVSIGHHAMPRSIYKPY